MNKKRLLLRSMLLLLVLSVDNVFAAAPPPPPAGGPPSLGKPQGAPNMTGLGIEGFNKGRLKKVPKTEIKDTSNPDLNASKKGSGGGAGPASSAGGGAGAGSAGTPAPRPGGGIDLSGVKLNSGAGAEIVAGAQQGSKDIGTLTKSYQNQNLVNFKKDFNQASANAQAQLYIESNIGAIEGALADGRAEWIATAVDFRPVNDACKKLQRQMQLKYSEKKAQIDDLIGSLPEPTGLPVASAPAKGSAPKPFTVSKPSAGSRPLPSLTPKPSVTPKSSSSAPEGSPAGPAHPFPAKSPAKSPAPAPSPSSSSSSSAASRSRKPADNQAWYIAHLERGFTLLAEREKMGAWANANNIASSNDLIREMNKIGAKWFGKASAAGAGKGSGRSTSPRHQMMGAALGEMTSGKKPAPASEPSVTPDSASNPTPPKKPVRKSSEQKSDPKGKEEEKDEAFAEIGDYFEIDLRAFNDFFKIITAEE
jgi:hypothetical protein